MPSRLTDHQSGLLAVLLAALLWSTGGLFIKLLPFDAFTILCYRAFFAAVLFAVLFRRRVWRFSRTTALVSFFYAALVICFVMATKRTTAANAIFLQYTAPIYLMMLEPLLFKFRLERINIVTVVFCFLGMALLFVGDLQVGNMGGNLLGLASGVFLAAMLLAQRFNHHDNHEAAIFQGNVLVTLLFLPAAAQAPWPSPTEWGMLLFLGLVQIGLGYTLFTYGLKRVLAIESSLIAMLEPVLNPVWVLIGYGERPGITAVWGGAVIVLTLIVRTVVVERGRARAELQHR